MPIPKLRRRTLHTGDGKVEIEQAVESKGKDRYRPLIHMTLTAELNEFVAEMTPAEAMRIGETLIELAQDIKHRCRPLPKIARGR